MKSRVEPDANLTNTESSSDYTKEEKIIPENKSTNNNLLKGMVIAIAIATFFAGFTLGNNLDGSEPEITKEDIRALEEKIENLKLPTSSPQPAQTQRDDAGAVLSPAAATDDAGVPQAADRDDAEVPAAAQALPIQAGRLLQRQHLPPGNVL